MGAVMAFGSHAAPGLERDDQRRVDVGGAAVAVEGGVRVAVRLENPQERMMAYVYWITIAGICFLGTVKPI